MEHEIWLTALFNKYLAQPANTALSLVGMKAEDPAHPWANYVTMEILVAAIVVVLFALLRPRLSMDRPGKFQHIFELIYGFLHGQTDDVVGHSGQRYMAFFGTLFIFILFGNLIGLIPTLESPTMFVAVPLGCALATLVYYNWVGIKEQGLFKYLKHFAGPMPALAPLMFPIEIISNMARPLSLTIRLYANMFGGERVTLAVMGLVPLLIPVPFLFLHIFVGVLQAYIFVLLTMVYVGDVVHSEEH
ncbi:MAG: F0F1 ATP synthase subunit A [Acidobacteriota bacterium]